MIYLYNIATIILAILFAFQVSNEKHKLITSAGLIILGFAFHIFEAYTNYVSNMCKPIETESILKAIDYCINYDSGIMYYAQAMIIAGFTVLVVNYYSSIKHNK